MICLCPPTQNLAFAEPSRFRVKTHIPGSFLESVGNTIGMKQSCEINPSFSLSIAGPHSCTNSGESA